MKGDRAQWFPTSSKRKEVLVGTSLVLHAFENFTFSGCSETEYHIIAVAAKQGDEIPTGKNEMVTNHDKNTI
jgi:hypothetical protein